MYEVGAGNGSFMLDALKYIREEHPDVYERTQYKIVEISPALAKIQKERASAAGLADKVDVINEDVMRWKGGRVEPCFVIALEVFVSCDVTPRSAEACKGTVGKGEKAFYPLKPTTADLERAGML